MRLRHLSSAHRLAASIIAGGAALAACSSAPSDDGGEAVQSSADALTISPIHPLQGALGTSCIPPTNKEPIDHCDDGLGCDWATNTCEHCGGSGQPCCDGAHTPFAGVCELNDADPADPCPVCDTGTCVSATHMCASCGTALGSACCPPDQATSVASCRAVGLTCNFANASTMTSGTCTGCGPVGEPPCPGSRCEGSAVESVPGTCVSCATASIYAASFTTSSNSATLTFFTGAQDHILVFVTDTSSSAVVYANVVTSNAPADIDYGTLPIPTTVQIENVVLSHSYSVTLTAAGDDGSSCPTANLNLVMPTENIVFTSGPVDSGGVFVNATLTLYSSGKWTLASPVSENLGYNLNFANAAYALYMKLSYVDPSGYGFRFLHVGTDLDTIDAPPGTLCQDNCAMEPISESGTDPRIATYWSEIMTSGMSGSLGSVKQSSGIGGDDPSNGVYASWMNESTNDAISKVESGSPSKNAWSSPIPLECPNTGTGVGGLVDYPMQGGWYIAGSTCPEYNDGGGIQAYASIETYGCNGTPITWLPLSAPSFKSQFFCTAGPPMTPSPGVGQCTCCFASLLDPFPSDCCECDSTISCPDPAPGTCEANPGAPGASYCDDGTNDCLGSGDDGSGDDGDDGTPTTDAQRVSPDGITTFTSPPRRAP